MALVNDDEIPVVPHDDGIFMYSKKLECAEFNHVDFAKEVIAAFREAEKSRKSKTPLESILKTRTPPLPPEELRRIRDSMLKQAGQFLHAPSLHQTYTRLEHQYAYKLKGFIRYPEPDYTTLKIANKNHAGYCWRVAILNAFRILDLMKDESVPFPHSWERVNSDRRRKNFSGLIGSAACLMALYYAKALAMPQAVAAIRGKPMVEGRKGRASPLGQLIYDACAEIERRGESLPEWNAPARVMEILKEWNKGSTKGALYRVKIAGKWETVVPKKIGDFVRRHRSRRR